MTEPLRDALAAALADTYWTSARPYPSWADAIIAALAQQGVTLTREPGLRECCQFACYEDPGCTCDGCVTREPGLDVLDAERLHDACVSLVGHAIGCPRGASEDRTQYTEDDPDWSAMVSPISETDGGHDDR